MQDHGTNSSSPGLAKGDWSGDDDENVVALTAQGFSSWSELHSRQDVANSQARCVALHSSRDWAEGQNRIGGESRRPWLYVCVKRMKSLSLVRNVPSAVPEKGPGS